MELQKMVLPKEEKLEQLDRLLQSRTLQGSENLQSFLKYIALKSINESTDQLKEYTIATEVFGRKNFSPRGDSIVRVQASRLRQKLHEYYSTEGKADRVLIELPKGHYITVFSRLGGEEAKVEGVKIEPLPLQLVAGNPGQGPFQRTDERVVTTPPERKWVIVLAVVLVALLSIATPLAISHINLRQQVREAASQIRVDRFGMVWEPFLQNSDQTLMILSNPAVYRLTNPKDTEAVLKNSIPITPGQASHVNAAVGDKFMVKHSAGRLVLCTDEYTGMGEAIGLARITELFRSAGRSALLKQSRTVSPEDLRNYNVVLLGSVWVNEWAGKPPIREVFTYSASGAIENLAVRPGEEREYGPKFDEDGKLVEDYGLITVKPNFQFRNTVMVLAGLHSEGTQAAAEYVTNPDYLNTLNDRLRQFSARGNPPKYYQALLKVAVENGMPTTITLISLREIPAEDS